MNKKGFMDDWGEFVSALIILAMVFSYFYFSIGTTAAKLEGKNLEKEQEVNLNYNLILFLQTPIDFNNERITMSDLIVWSYANDDYTRIEKETESFFSDILSGAPGWAFVIKLMPEEKTLTSIVEDIELIEPLLDAYAYVPLPNSQNYIEIDVYVRWAVITWEEYEQSTKE